MPKKVKICALFYTLHIYFFAAIQLCRNHTTGPTGELTQAIKDFPFCDWNITVSSEYLVLLTFEYLDTSPSSNYYGLSVSFNKIFMK